MKRKRYDVVVVGCGPSGAMAGKFAALGGAETLIVEGKRQIGFPNPDPMSIIFSKSELEEIAGEEIDPAIIYSRCEGLTYISPGGKEGKPYLLEDSYFVNRPMLEKSFAIGAVRAGAEIMVHTRAVDVVREDGAVKGIIIKNGTQLVTIPCSLVIAADGSYQYIGRRAGIQFPNRVADMNLGCEFVGVKSLRGANKIDEIYLDDSGEAQYRFVAPYGQDRFSVSIGVTQGYVRQKKSLKQRLDDFIGHVEALGRYDFSKASPVSMVASGSAYANASTLASDGIILVGTAAGRVVFGSRSGGAGSISGAGSMIGASRSGRIVGEIAADAIRKGDVSKGSLEGKYRGFIDDSLQGEGPRILEALRAWRQILGSGSREQDRAVDEIGDELARIHFYSKGALPLRTCLEPVQKWLREVRGGKS